MMTLDEMQQAVCGKLPEMVLEIEDCTDMGVTIARRHVIKHENGEFPNIHWPTEGLQVCHEAEKLILDEDKTGDMWVQYIARLQFKVGQSLTNSQRLKGRSYHATWEQRLEALCRVWWPERFQ